MKRALMVWVFILLASCSPEQDTSLPVITGDLHPHLTRTPSLTPEHPSGLVESYKTPLPSPTPFSYEVQQGDTLGGIALKFGVSLDELVAANPDVLPNSMSIGTELQIPSSPANPSGASTPTPVPAPVKQIVCYPTADSGMWCFVLVYNDTSDLIENLSAQVILLGADGQSLASAQAVSPLNILPPDAGLPLVVFFPPQIPADARPQVRILTGIRLLPGDERYLPAAVQNTLVQVDGSGRSAQVSGTVRLPSDSNAAGLVWVAAVAYDESGRVISVRRWESDAGIPPGGSLEFSFMVSSLAGPIGRVEFVVEARP